ncbi:hypothetical protein HanIR_Chr04g0175451 [Helianthus annuus]|nr:hypothetical protein HanIR_Chr04g0175451 [Helianthus annuus]
MINLINITDLNHLNDNQIRREISNSVNSVRLQIDCIDCDYTFIFKNVIYRRSRK